MDKTDKSLPHHTIPTRQREQCHGHGPIEAFNIPVNSVTDKYEAYPGCGGLHSSHSNNQSKEEEPSNERRDTFRGW